MAMNSMAHETMEMDNSDMHGMAMGDVTLQPASFAISDVSLLSTSQELAPANKLEVPIDACTHCMSHSGTQNAPVSSVTVGDQSYKNVGSAQLPITNLLAQPGITLAQLGLPREHAPPGSTAPRHLLINIFLI
jgi:hypothetical protein